MLLNSLYQIKADNSRKSPPQGPIKHFIASEDALIIVLIVLMNLMQNYIKGKDKELDSVQ